MQNTVTYTIRRIPRTTTLLRLLACMCVSLVFAMSLPVASAEDTSLKDGAKRAGHAVGSAVREIGQGAKKAGKAVGNAAKEGGKEFSRALKGESH
jgi:hypothetical protein